MKTVDRGTAQRVFRLLGHDAVKRSGFPAYYIFNTNHPIMKNFLRQFRAENGLGNYPLSDVQRVQLELSLLNAPALAAVLKMCEAREKEKKEKEVYVP